MESSPDEPTSLLLLLLLLLLSSAIKISPNMVAKRKLLLADNAVFNHPFIAAVANCILFFMMVSSKPNPLGRCAWVTSGAALDSARVLFSHQAASTPCRRDRFSHRCGRLYAQPLRLRNALCFRTWRSRADFHRAGKFAWRHLRACCTWHRLCCAPRTALCSLRALWRNRAAGWHLAVRRSCWMQP